MYTTGICLYSSSTVSPVRSSDPAATAVAVQKIIARTAAQQWSLFCFFFFPRFLYFGAFYLEFSVKTAISPSLRPFSILTEVLEIHIFTFFGLFEKMYLDFSVDENMLKLV